MQSAPTASVSLALHACDGVEGASVLDSDVSPHVGDQTVLQVLGVAFALLLKNMALKRDRYSGALASSVR